MCVRMCVCTCVLVCGVCIVFVHVSTNWITPLADVLVASIALFTWLRLLDSVCMWVFTIA